MIWPWLDSLTGTSGVCWVRQSEPGARKRGSGRRIGRGTVAKSLQHDHCHLRQQLAEILQGRYSGGRHPALVWHAGQPVAEGISQAVTEFLCSLCHVGIVAIPWHQHADPGLVKAVELAKLLLMRRRNGHPCVDEAQA